MWTLFEYTQTITYREDRAAMKLEFKANNGDKEMTLADFAKITETVVMNGGDPATIVPRIMITFKGRPTLVSIEFDTARQTV